MKKLLVVGIVILFFGVGIAPSITANIENISSIHTFNSDNELIEYSVELIGIEGTRTHTVMLSQKQSDDLEKLFADLELKLDNAVTREETIAVFEQAVSDLNELGMFPDDVSVEEVQKLVIDRYQNSEVIKVLDGDIIEIVENDFCENYNCLIAGKTSHTSTWSIITRSSIVIYSIMEYLFDLLWNKLSNYFEEHGMWDMLDLLPYLLYIPYSILLMLNTLFLFTMFTGMFLSFLNPLSIWQILDIGYAELNWDMQWIPFPADGWIYTIGLNGTQTWDGDLFGQIQNLPIVWALNRGSLVLSKIYPGASGFIGIKSYNPNSTFYIGYAKHVKVGSEPI